MGKSLSVNKLEVCDRSGCSSLARSGWNWLMGLGIVVLSLIGWTRRMGRKAV